jgi:ParB-like chromosome segregation protein Spo0J
MTYAFHEYANLFPLLANGELNQLADDIAENGLSSPITIYEGKILDGRNRYRACQIAEVTPKFEEYKGKDPLAFVVSHNLHRRHLTESQRGAVATKLATLKNGQKQASSIGLAATQQQAAEMLNVSVSTLKRASRVEKQGAPELIKAVESGEIKLGAAETILTLPKSEQAALVKEGVEAVREKAAEIRGTTAAPTRFTVNMSSGMGICATAKSVMDRINPKDAQRVEALEAMISYCENRIKQNK